MSDVNTMTEAEELIDRLTAAEAVWAATPVSERVSMLRRMHADVAANAAQWVQVARTIKVLPAESPLVGEEWFGGPYVVLEYVRLLIQTLSRLQQGTDVLAGYEAGSAPGERLALHVAPHGAFDRLLYSGYTTQVWMTPGVTMDQVRSQAGLAQRTPTRTHGVSLVLGAGNVFSIPVLDVLYQLFAANRVVVLKLNPITDPMLEIFERIFAAFVEPGVVRIVTGGAETGDLLASSADVTAVHMTGSEATHDAIVWGFGEDGATAKAAGTPRLDKPVTSELGGVSPVIIVPGRWSKADLRFQARHVATMRLHNSGCNCVAAQIVIMSSHWPQRAGSWPNSAQPLPPHPSDPAGTQDATPGSPQPETRIRTARYSMHPQDACC